MARGLPGGSSKPGAKSGGGASGGDPTLFTVAGKPMLKPLRAFAEYQAFESMMRRAADEEDDLGI